VALARQCGQDSVGRLGLQWGEGEGKGEGHSRWWGLRQLAQEGASECQLDNMGWERVCVTVGLRWQA